MIPTNTHIGNNRTAGFTLVELLLVIAIIGVLSSLALAVVAGAQNEAKRSATVARLSQIRVMMLDRLESYEFRKIPVRLKKFSVGIGQDGREETRRVSNRIIADMINVEMPRTGLGGPAQQNEPYFPSMALKTWLEDLLGTRPMDGPLTAAEALIEELGKQRSIIVDQVQLISGSLNESGSKGLAFILQTTDVDGTTGVDVLGSRAFANLDNNDNLLSVVDAWNDEIGFELNLTDADGNLYVDGSSEPLDLNQLIGDTNVYDIPIQDIVIRFITVNPL